MMEALISVAITATAGAALLTSIGSTVLAGKQAIHQAVGRGIAEQLMDEISSVRFPVAGSTRNSPTPTMGGLQSRAEFDDVDDYHGWTSTPPVNRNGLPLGTEGTANEISRAPQMQPNLNFIQRFTHAVEVERVEPDDAGGFRVVNSDSDWRRVTVRVLYTDAAQNSNVVAEISRTFSYVAAAP